MKTILTTIIIFLGSLNLMAQNGTIKGTVKTSDGEPAEFVTISLQGTTKGVTVNQKGQYTISNITPGTYKLVASFVGLATQTRDITVGMGDNLTEDFTLREDNQKLQEIVVSSGTINKFTLKQSQDVAKLPLKNLENPQIYSVVTNELMQEQLTTNISQALSNVPGAVPSKDPAGGTSITLRGFTAEVGARNGVQFLASGRSGVDPINVDHFEVLKGPSAVLYGNTVSSYGGAINMVTKKPFETFKGEASYSVGSFGLNRFTVDINTPLNASKTLLLRTNAAVNREKSFLNAGHNNTITFAPSLTYKATNKLTFQLDVEAYKEDLTRTPYLVPLPSIKSISEVPLPYKTSLYGDDLNAVTNTFRTYFQVKYQINDQWYSQTNVSVNRERVDHSYQYYPTFLSATIVDRDVALFGPITTVNADVQHNLHGDFNFGKIRNRFVWGLDYIHTKVDFAYNFATVDTIDISKPYNIVTKSMADLALQSNQAGSYPSRINQYATYVSDLVNLTDNLMVLLSGRLDRYQSQGEGGYGQTSVTPKFGLIYQPVKDRVSIFGNYMSGFTNNGPIIQPGGATFIPKPEFGRQFEGGVKLDVIHDLVSASLSYYQINVDNSIRYDNANVAFQDGKQKSQGYEASLTSNPLKGLNILAGYVYNKNQYIRSASGEGKDISGTPRNVANIWASYKLQWGLGIGAGSNYVQKSYYDTDNTIIIPSFVLFNASVFYDQPKWRVGVAGNNLGNKQYWSPSFTANPQVLRQIIAKFTFKF